MTTPLRRTVDHLRRLAWPAAADSQLLAAFAAGRDEDAFAEIVRRHGPLVRGVCRRQLGDAPEADDAFQATFLLLAQRAGRGDWGATVGPWLFAAARRVAANARVAAERRRRAEGRAAAPTPSPEPPATAALAEVRRLLDDELAALPGRLRGPLVLCYLEGQTRDEAASRLAVSVATLKRRLARGRLLLRHRLERRGVALSLAGVAVLAEDAAVTAAQARAATALAAGSTVPAAVASLLPGAPLATAGKLVAASLAAAFVGLGLAWQAGGAPLPQAPPVAQGARDVKDDPLPPGAVARLGSTALRPGQWLVNSVATTPDGRRAAVCGQSSVTVWDMESGRMVGTPLAADGRCTSVALSADGGTLVAVTHDVSAQKTAVTRWDVATGEKRSQSVKPLEFIKRTYGTGDRAREQSGVVATLAPDGATLATLDVTGKAHLWSVNPWRETSALATEGFLAESLDFSGDGKFIASWAGGVLCVWDVATGRETGRAARPGDPPAKTIPSPDGKLVAVLPRDPDRTGISIPYAAAGAVEVWDVSAGVKRHTLPPADHVGGVTWASDGKSFYVVAGPPYELSRWDAATGVKTWSHGLRGGFADAWLLAPADGRGLTGYSLGRLYHWDAATGHELPSPEGHIGWVRPLEFLDGGRVVATTDSGGIRRRWDAATGKLLGTETGRPSTSLGALHAPGGHRHLAYLGGHFDSDAALRASDGRELRRWSLMRLDGAAFSPDGGRLAFVNRGGKLIVCDAESGREVWSVTTSADAKRVAQLAFAPDGRLMLADGERLWLWDAAGRPLADRSLASLEPLPEPPPPGSPPQPAQPPLGSGSVFLTNWAFTTDGRTLAVSRDGTTFVCDATTGHVRHSFRGPGETQALAFAPDGRALASGARDGTVRVWDAATGVELRSFPGHRGSVVALAFSRDGTKLASSADDLTVLVWDVSAVNRR